MTKAEYMFDAAFSNPAQLASVKQHGGIAMSCYLTGEHGTTSPQPAALHALGLGALGNYEKGPGDLITAGTVGGKTVGQVGCDAWAAKGAPENTGLAIAYSVDVNCPPSRYGDVASSFEGINNGANGRFEAMVYGQGGLITFLADRGLVVPVNWLSASKSFPGYNAKAADVALVQQVGSPVAGTDRDLITNLTALAPYIWWPAGSKYEGADVNASDTLVATDGTKSTVGGFIANGERHALAADQNSAAILKLLTDLVPRVASLQAQVAALQNGQVNVAGSVPATLTFGSKS